LEYFGFALVLNMRLRNIESSSNTYEIKRIVLIFIPLSIDKQILFPL